MSKGDMKNLLLLSILVFFSQGGFSQVVKNDAELGNEVRYLAQCWDLNGLEVSNHPPTLIDGKFSFRSIELQKASLDDSYLKTPWLMLRNGKVSFTTRLDGSAGGNRSIVVQYIAINENDYSEATPISFYTFDFSNPINKNTTVYDVSFSVPSSLTKGQLYKLKLSLTGTGGSARVGLDDLVIPGEYYSDPSNLCLPLSIEPDADNDGVVDSEDEFPTDPHRAYSSYFPNKNYGTLMFEDLWPGIGDYDFNDLVVDYRIKKVTDAKNEMVEMIVDLKTRAIGAGFKNGFGIEFTGVAPGKVISVSGTKISGSSIHQFAPNGLEVGNQWMTFIPLDNAFAVLPHPGGGVTGVNTDPRGPRQEVLEQTVIVTFKKNGLAASGGAVRSNEISLDNFNPFLIRNQDRSIEVHLPGKPPTRHANQALFGSIDDNSNASHGVYYQSKGTNLPWALHVNQSVPYMIEKYNINQGFIKFEEWVRSNGTAFPDWYLDRDELRNNSLIF